MKYFLQLVAESLRSHFGNNLSRTVVIFPNKRASLFLNDFLLQQEDEPVWSPRYMTISELFCSLTTTKIDDPINTVCRIFKHYVRLTQTTDETLDFFYGWGERILADFDDLDKNLGDAEHIFRDLRDYQEIGEEEDFLTEEQAEQLRRFAGDFAQAERSIVRQRYLKLWNALLPLYHVLRNELSKEGLAYEGQLYRSVVEALEKGEVALPKDVDHVAFVGFNVLDKAEKKLFSLLQKEGKALFYWDYDTFYVGKTASLSVEAGTFLKENLKNFPNELSEQHFHNFTARSTPDRPIDITFATANTNTVQAQYVRQWLSAEAGHFSPHQAKRTAIVLCDENMLEPVLHALPTKNDYKVNVTKGFPLNHTPAYTCVAQVMDQTLYDLNVRAANAQRNTSEKSLTVASLSATEAIGTLLRLQQLVQEQALLAKEHTAEGSWNDILYTEAYFQVYTVISRFVMLFEEGQLTDEKGQSIVGLTTLFRLIRQVMRNVSIPFHGEPAVGLQVMGVLETRCLDFDHVLLLSVNEGKLPQKAADASFIPFLIRKRYGLTTYVHKVAVYAYYFFRLLQRCQTATLCYNASTAGTEKGEMSRFMRSMLIDEKLSPCISYAHLNCIPKPSPSNLLVPQPNSQRTEPIVKRISPTTLNDYIACPRSFFYKHVLRLKTPQTSDNIVDQRDLGTLFHRTVETLYMNSLGKDGQLITPAIIKRFLKESGDAAILEEVKRVFVDKQIAYTSLAETVAFKFAKLLLRYEAHTKEVQQVAAEAFSMVAAELDVACHINVPFGKDGKMVSFELGGQIDRIDKATLPNGNTCLRIVDYKTGGSPCEVKDMDQLFHPSSTDDPKYIRQTFLYCFMLMGSPKYAALTSRPLMPALFYVPRMVRNDFTPYLSFGGTIVEDFRPLANEFKEQLTNTLAEIIDPENNFPTKENKLHCQWCDFKALCGSKF